MYFSLNPALVYRSLSAAQSSGASEGTLVTIPVPLVIEMVYMGRAYTYSNCARGALSFIPISSYPLTLASIGYLACSLVRSWKAIFLADLSEQIKNSLFLISNTPYSPSGRI